MTINAKITPWLVWGMSVFFYFYQFMIRVATSNLRDPLTIEFNLTASDYGMFASYWLISYALLQIPVGIALDKWGPKKILTLSITLCGIGTFMMAYTENFSTLCLARLFIGAGSASAFVGTFKISSEWFPPSMLPILVGIVSGVGVLGASFAGAPLILLQNYIGWRPIFYGLSGIAFIMAIIYGVALKDQMTSSDLRVGNMIKEVSKLMKESQILLLGSIGLLLYTPVSVMADLWGPSFIKNVYGYTSIESAIVTSFIFYGNAIGSFCIGWFFFKFNKNQMFFSLFTGVAWVLISIILWVNLPNLWILCVCFFALGGVVSAENLIFPIGARYVSAGYEGLSASVINFFVMVGAIALQPSVGWIMDALWSGDMLEDTPIYSAHDYRWGLSILSICLGLSFCLSFVVKGKTKI